MAPAANIGPSGVRRRRRLGLLALGVGIAGAFALRLAGTPALSRVVLFPAYWGAGVGLFQAREKT